MTLTDAQKRLVEENIGLVHACANRFKGRGVEYEDLFGAGSVGLVKAAGGFDETLGYRFSTYAVPAILGEIKRVFRDGGSVKIGRSAKEKARRLLAVRDELAAALDREPDIGEIARAAGTDPSEAAVLLCACLPTVSLTPEEGGETDVPVPAPEESIQRRLDLSSALSRLPENEKRLLRLRYFEERTQSVTAGILGMTQVQVSRKEKQILLKLREMME